MPKVLRHKGMQKRGFKETLIDDWAFCKVRLIKHQATWVVWCFCVFKRGTCRLLSLPSREWVELSKVSGYSFNQSKEHWKPEVKMFILYIFWERFLQLNPLFSCYHMDKWFTLSSFATAQWLFKSLIFPFFKMNTQLNKKWRMV